MSPTLFRERGYRFFFFSREEARMHVHVYHADGEAKFWLEPTKRRSAMPGVNTSPVEVSGVSKHGFWLLLDDSEMFVAFAEFPWFKTATVEAIFHVERPQAHHLYWPDLDVDLDVESIRHPESFPLIAKPRH